MATGRVLSVRPGWAWAIIHGPRRVENRSWRTCYRGPLYIHASKNWSKKSGVELAAICRGAGIASPKMADLKFGWIIGICEIYDCVSYEDVPLKLKLWAEQGKWCWLLKNIRAMDPIEHRGRLGLCEMHLL